MAKQRPDGKRFFGAQSSIERHLERLEYGTIKKSPERKMVECRAPSCNKVIEARFTRNGYCMGCVKKAIALRERREQEARELKEMYADDSFGAF